MLRRQDIDDAHRRTAMLAGEGEEVVCAGVVSCRSGVCADRLGFKQRPGKLEVVVPGGVGEEPVMADAVEAFGQDVLQEAADELVSGQCHGLPLDFAVAIILVAEGDAALIEGCEPAV